MITIKIQNYLQLSIASISFVGLVPSQTCLLSYEMRRTRLRLILLSFATLQLAKLEPFHCLKAYSKLER